MKNFILIAITVLGLTSCSNNDDVPDAIVEDLILRDKYQIIVTSPSWKSLENTTLLVNDKAYSGCGGAAVEPKKITVQVISDFSATDTLYLEFYQFGQLVRQEKLVGSDEIKAGSYTRRHCWEGDNTVTVTNGKLMVNKLNENIFIKE